MVFEAVVLIMPAIAVTAGIILYRKEKKQDNKEKGNEKDTDFI